MRINVLVVFNSEARPNQVSFGGVVKGESAMKTEEEIGSLINFTFRVSLFIRSEHSRMVCVITEP